MNVQWLSGLRLKYKALLFLALYLGAVLLTFSGSLRLTATVMFGAPLLFIGYAVTQAPVKDWLRSPNGRVSNTSRGVLFVSVWLFALLLAMFYDLHFYVLSAGPLAFGLYVVSRPRNRREFLELGLLGKATVLVWGVLLTYYALLAYPPFFLYGLAFGLPLLSGLRSLVKWFHRRSPAQGTYHAKWADLKTLTAANLLVPGGVTSRRMLMVGALKLRNVWTPVAVQPGHAGRAELGNFLTVGPPGSGKGRQITTNLFCYPESVIVLDVKGENFEQTAGVRSQFSHVFALHPEGKGVCFDPLKHLSHNEEALRSAANLIIDPSQDKDPAFAQAAENALYAALLAARLEDAPTLPYLQALLDEGVMGFVAHLTNLNDRKVRSALIRFTTVKPEEFTMEFFSKNGLVRGAWGTLNTRLAALMTDGVMAMMSGNDFTPQDFYTAEYPCSLYLVFPETSTQATAKAFSLVVMSLMMGLIEYYDKAERKPERQVLLMLDEAGRVRVPNLEQYLATIRGRNIVASLYLQDLDQLKVLYGPEEASSIVGQCKTQTFHPTTHVPTQQYVSAATGLVSLYQVQYDDQLGQFFGLGTKVNEQHRPLLTPDEVRQLGADSVIIFSANVPPIHATRLDPFMFSNLEVKTPPLLPGLEGEPYVLPGPRQVELEPSEPFVPGVDEAVPGRARAEPEF